jgi:hypothetical protein
MTDQDAQAGATPQTASGAILGSATDQKISNVFGGINQPATSSHDPLRVLLDIVKDPSLSESEKQALIGLDRQRFTNRRRMAYLALTAIIGTLVFVLLASVLDASPDRALACATAAKATGAAIPDCGSILKNLASAQTLLSWIMGVLASIVGAYYGFSSLRPSS